MKGEMLFFVLIGLAIAEFAAGAVLMTFASNVAIGGALIAIGCALVAVAASTRKKHRNG